MQSEFPSLSFALLLLTSHCFLTYHANIHTQEIANMLTRNLTYAEKLTGNIYKRERGRARTKGKELFLLCYFQTVLLFFVFFLENRENKSPFEICP